MPTAAQRKINICIRMPPRLLEALRREAARDQRTVSDYIRIILLAREQLKGRSAT
jgi:hypothetical protein